MNNKEEKHFKKLKGMFKKRPEGIAQSEAVASKNPEKFIKDNKNMSIKGRKGVAF